MDADGNIWAVVPVKETAAAKQRLAGLLVAGARRQLALAMLADVLQAIAGVPELAGIVAVTVDPDAADIALRAGEQAWGEAHRDGHTGAVMAADLQIADRQEVRNRQARDAYDRHRRLRNCPGREVWLELDDGKQVHLRPHDVVVQNGTRHAWRNKRDRPVKMAFVLIGARRNA